MAVARPKPDTNAPRKYPTLSHSNSKNRCNRNPSLTSPPRRTSSSSSSHNPSCASSSSGYASYTSFRSSTSQSNHQHNSSHYETIEAIRSAARPNSSTEHRRPRRILSPRPDSRAEVRREVYTKISLIGSFTSPSKMFRKYIVIDFMDTNQF